VVMCLDQGADLHVAQLMPLPLTVSCSSKPRLVLPFWCRLTWVFSDKMQEGRKPLCVCMHACVHACVVFYHIIQVLEYILVFTEMHETLRSNSQLNTRCHSYADEKHHYSRFPLASPKSSRVRKGDCIKSLALTQLPSTKLGLYKALQPLLKLASPSRLEGLVILHYITLCTVSQN